MGRSAIDTSDEFLTTTTSATYTTKVTITNNPALGNTVVFHTSFVDNTTTNSDARIRLRDTTNNIEYANFNIEPQDSTDIFPVVGFAYIEGDPGYFGVGNNIELEYSSEGGTTGISDAYVVGLTLESTDLISENLTPRRIVSSTSQNLAVVTCNTGSWLLIASCEANTADTTPATTLNYELHDGTNLISFTGPPYVQDVTNYSPVFMMAYVTPTTTTNYAFRFKSDGTATLGARNSRLLALDLSKFKSFRIAQDLNTITVVGTGSVDVLTLDANYVGEDNYLIMYSGSSSGTSTTSSHFIDLTLDQGGLGSDSLLATRAITREMNDVNEYYDYGGVRVMTMFNKRNIFKQQASNESSAQNVAVKNKVLAMLQLGDSRLNRRTITVR